jgi:hypothetical protein
VPAAFTETKEFVSVNPDGVSVNAKYVELPALFVTQDKVPLPFVESICPFVPSALGRVHVISLAIVAGALKF